MLDNYINQIENILYDKAIKMETPTLEEDLGALVFEATLYRYSKNEVFKEKTLLLLNKLTSVFSDRKLPTGFLEGFEGILYTIQYLHQCKIIEDTSLLENLEDHLLKSLHNDFKTNNFDPLHGSIGKFLYFLKKDQKKTGEQEKLIDQFLNALYNNRQETELGIFWYDHLEDTEGLVNMGVAHGLPGILAFLVRLKELKVQHHYLDILIAGILKSLSSFKNKRSVVSMYPSDFSENEKDISMDSRLGWCSGDLGIAHTLVYAGKVLEDKNIEQEASSVLSAVVGRRVSTSFLTHYEDYSFFDTGFCHGISGITYIFKKINQELNNDILSKRISFWEKELLLNLDRQLGVKDDIYLPWYRQDENYTYTLDKESMLNGLSGVGLVLLSMRYEKYDWSDFFMLF